MKDMDGGTIAHTVIRILGESKAFGSASLAIVDEAEVQNFASSAKDFTNLFL